MAPVSREEFLGLVTAAKATASLLLWANLGLFFPGKSAGRI